MAAAGAADPAGATAAEAGGKKKRPALQLYRQTFRDRLSVIEPPVVSAAPRGARPYTRVSFVPAYAALGYPTPLSAADADRGVGYPSAAYAGTKLTR
ncbi:MAG: hypothetical protein EBU46_20555, partial [Nitrosomonadaceae bacterium]|nr:hypothetical protein [Nitrosomonadaceae bacterium]